MRERWTCAGFGIALKAMPLGAGDSGAEPIEKPCGKDREGREQDDGVGPAAQPVEGGQLPLREGCRPPQLVVRPRSPVTHAAMHGNRHGWRCGLLRRTGSRQPCNVKQKQQEEALDARRGARNNRKGLDACWIGSGVCWRERHSRVPGSGWTPGEDGLRPDARALMFRSSATSIKIGSSRMCSRCHAVRAVVAKHGTSGNAGPAENPGELTFRGCDGQCLRAAREQWHTRGSGDVLAARTPRHRCAGPAH